MPLKIPRKVRAELDRELDEYVSRFKRGVRAAVREQDAAAEAAPPPPAEREREER